MKVQSDNVNAQALLDASRNDVALSDRGLAADGRAHGLDASLLRDTAHAAEPRDAGEDVLAANVWGDAPGTRTLLDRGPSLDVAGIGADTHAIDRAVDAILARLV